MTLTQFGVLSTTATLTSAENVGRFTTIFLVFVASAGAFQAIPLTWLLTSSEDVVRTKQFVAGALFSVSYVAIPSAVVIAGMCAFGYPVTLCIVVFLATVGRLMSDVYRIYFYKRQKEGAALAVSLTSTLLFVAIVFARRETAMMDWKEPVAILAIALLVPPIALAIRARTVPTYSAFIHFKNATQGKWGSLGVSYSADYLAGLLTPVAIAVAGGYPSAGAVRAAQSLVGIPLQIPRGLQALFTAQVSRSYHLHAVVPKSSFIKWVLLQIVLVAPFIVFLPLIPDRIGEGILGETWGNTRDILSAVCISALALQLATTADIYFRIVDRVSRMAVVRVASFVPMVGSSAVGAHLAGVQGAAWGMMAGSVFTVALAAAFALWDWKKATRATGFPEELDIEHETEKVT